jgi:hypothetical protein
MLRSKNRLIGFSVHATDGEIGRIRDFVFDEPLWTVRYAEVDISKWIPEKVVLLSTLILGQTALSSIDTKLTIEQIINCPAIDPHHLPSRKYEEELHTYFSWTYYWAQLGEASQYQSSCKLQNVKAINGYHIQALDGELGHLSDLLIDDLEWKIRYCVIDTGTWLPGKKVLLSPKWLGKIDDQAFKIEFDIKMEKIKTAPDFDQSTLVTPDYESSIFAHFDKKPYWNV